MNVFLKFKPILGKVIWIKHHNWGQIKWVPFVRWTPFTVLMKKMFEIIIDCIPIHINVFISIRALDFIDQSKFSQDWNQVRHKLWLITGSTGFKSRHTVRPDRPTYHCYRSRDDHTWNNLYVFRLVENCFRDLFLLIVTVRLSLDSMYQPFIFDP